MGNTSVQRLENYKEGEDMSFMFLHSVSQRIRELAGNDVYHKYGDEILECIKRDCYENGEEVRYPEDAEILVLADDIISFYEGVIV